VAPQPGVREARDRNAAPDGTPRVEQFNVTPVQAAIIMQFQSSPLGANGRAKGKEPLGRGRGKGEGDAGGQGVARRGRGAAAVARLRAGRGAKADSGNAAETHRSVGERWVVLETASQTVPVEPLYIAADSAEALGPSRGAGEGGWRGSTGWGDEGEEEGSMVASIEAQREEDSAVHESFIMGMLM